MKSAYVDSSVWIGRVEGLPNYRQTINAVLNELINGGSSLCISEAVLLEVLAKPYKNNDILLVNLYSKLFAQVKGLKIYPDVFKNALMLSSAENLSAMDAVHVCWFSGNLTNRLRE
ncbi:MAG: PIN domain nuclease [Gammaproteobacteria bacterium]|nr:PIN domain nuclease [Gammaproteobacteria bacterium]